MASIRPPVVIFRRMEDNQKIEDFYSEGEYYLVDTYLANDVELIYKKKKEFWTERLDRINGVDKRSWAQLYGRIKSYFRKEK